MLESVPRPLPTFLGDLKYLDVTKDPQGQLQWLRTLIKEQVNSKQQSEQNQVIGWTLFGILTVFLITRE